METDLVNPPGVYARLVGNSWVFLDITRDKYFCLTGEPARLYSELVASGSKSPSSAKRAALAKMLVTRGLLAGGVQAGLTDVYAKPISFRGALDDIAYPLQISVRLQDIARFAREYAICAHLQNPRRRNLVQIFHDVTALKSKAQQRRKRDERDAADLTRSFQQIVPWFFSTHDACFFSSLLLVRFLARGGVTADWVFGVRLSPFRAHCWVSYQGLILNEDSHVVEGFEPILIV